MSEIPHWAEWPASNAKTIVVHPPKDGCKRPIGFAPWPEQKEPSKKGKKKKKPSTKPSAGPGGSE